MHASPLAAKVQALFHEDHLSCRAIALRLGISRPTVTRILRGLPTPRIMARNTDPGCAVRSAVRCPDCGGLVFPPCYLCDVRRLKAIHAVGRPPGRTRSRISGDSPRD
jgi:hypothetical protein